MKMKVFVLLSALFAVGCCETYYTINSNLKAYFANGYDSSDSDGMERKSEWDDKENVYYTYGLPHYEVPCDGTPNSAGEQDISLVIDDSHESGTMYSLPMGPIGFALNGVSIYDAVDADEEDAYGTEGRTMDACGAHSDGSNRYHYHSNPGGACPSSMGSTKCFPQVELSDVSSDDGTVYLIGVAIDGFPIFVTIDDSENVVEESGLDSCGGKVYDADNSYYAYYMYPNFPYTIRCLTGTVNSLSGTEFTVKTTKNFECDGNTDGDATYLCYRKGSDKATEVQCLPDTDTDCSTVSCFSANDGKCLDSYPTDAWAADNW